MVNKNTPNFIKRFMVNRKGTAEVIGTVLFIIILLFAFSNIYLWHDTQVKTMNTLLSDKLNSQVEVYWLLDANGKETSTIAVTNTGGISTSLSRLWIVTNSGTHRYANLEDASGNFFSIAAGNTVTIVLSGTTSTADPIPATWTNSVATVSFNKADGETFTVLTTLGNMASPQGMLKVVNQIGGGDGGNENSNSPVGSVIVANFSTFDYYTVSGSSLGSSNNGYNINSNGAPVAFSVVLTNMDENHRNIVLNYTSQMFFIDTFNPTKVGYLIFYTVNVDNNGNISPTYSNVNLDYGKPTTVYFASANAIFGSSHYKAMTLVTTGSKADPGVYPLNLALLGSFSDGSVLGQNVPFVSVYINS